VSAELSDVAKDSTRGRGKRRKTTTILAPHQIGRITHLHMEPKLLFGLNDHHATSEVIKRQNSYNQACRNSISPQGLPISLS